MPPCKPSDFPLLLEVFRDGLIMRVITRDEIIAWADNIINAEPQPDYFFIELSLAHNVNAMAEVFDRNINWSGSPIPLRVIFGLIHRKLTNGDISIEEAAKLLGGTPFRDSLTDHESSEVYALDWGEFCYYSGADNYQEAVVNFLSVYDGFNLLNCDQWTGINTHVEETLKEQTIERAARYKVFHRKWKRKRIRQKLKRFFLPVSLMVIIVGGVLTADIIQLSNGGFEPRPGGSDYPLILLITNIVLVINMIRLGHKWWRERR